MRDSLDPKLRDQIAAALERQGIKATSAAYPSIAYETLLKLRLELGISPKRTGPAAITAETLIGMLSPEQIGAIKSAGSLRETMRLTGLGTTLARRVHSHLIAAKATPVRITVETLMQKQGFSREAMIGHFQLHTNRHLADQFVQDLSVIARLRAELGLPPAKVGRPFATAASSPAPHEDLAAQIEKTIRERGLPSAMRRFKRAGVDRGQVARIYLERVQPTIGANPAASLAAMSDDQLAILSDMTIHREEAATALGISRYVVTVLRNHLGAEGVTRDYVRLYTEQRNIDADELRATLDSRSLGESASLLGCSHGTIRKLRVQLRLPERPDRVRIRLLRRMDEIYSLYKISGIDEFSSLYGSLTDEELRDKFNLTESCVTALRVEVTVSQSEAGIAA